MDRFVVLTVESDPHVSAIHWPVSEKPEGPEGPEGPEEVDMDPNTSRQWRLVMFVSADQQTTPKQTQTGSVSLFLEERVQFRCWIDEICQQVIGVSNPDQNPCWHPTPDVSGCFDTFNTHFDDSFRFICWSLSSAETKVGPHWRFRKLSRCSRRQSLYVWIIRTRRFLGNVFGMYGWQTLICESAGNLK